ncbi:MAG: Ca2+-dependent phosphoinositide-specific phospholipase C [Candidatus Marinimicrobia bacterium]|nr:Ca2+-dependent phosphoinositide-specific phospholipase C [Candidatus Neomarinimicrobiota bacterium]
MTGKTKLNPITNLEQKIIVFILCSLTLLYPQPPEFNYTESPLSATVLGQATFETFPASNGDWIAAFDSDGVCSGSSEIVEFDNRSNFLLEVFGDDPSTETVDEGLTEDDYFTFSFFDFSSNIIIHDTTKMFGWENRNGGWLNLNQNDSLLTLINELRLNQLQVIGSHNSYHIAPYDTLMGVINVFAPELGMSIDYTHELLADQFLNFGIRQIELDVYRDPEGGLFASRMGNWLTGQDLTPDIPELSEPGLKVLHFPDIDFDTHLITFRQGLEELKLWSDTFPGHVPIFVLVECKSDGLENYFDEYPQLENLLLLLPDSVTYTIPLEFDLLGLEEAEAEIRDVFGESLEKVITPDDVRGNFPTLEDAVLNGGWPTLGETRGKVMFGLDNQGTLMDDYMNGYPSLSGRILFTEAPPGTPEAAFLGINTPSPEIIERVNQGYLVRTRADTDTEQARTGDTSRRDDALTSGAHFVSTDYYRPDPRHEFDSGWTDYSVRLPENNFVRINPVNGPQELADPEVDLINFNMSINFIGQCEVGYTEILDLPESVNVLDNGSCFYQSDLDVLQKFIDNSQSGNNPPPSYLTPIELGEQVWGNGRLTEFKCSTLWPTYLDFELSGDIPEGLSSLSELTDIFLNANQLTSIPDDIGNLTNLNLLELGGNQISSIPGSIGNLNNLQWFYIYNNQLTYLPQQICYILDNLSSFSIEYNLLCPGTYPDCVEDFLSVQDTSNCFEICEEFAINNIQIIPNTEWGNGLLFYIDIPEVDLYAPDFTLQTDDQYLSIIDPVYSFFYITGPTIVDLLYYFEYENVPYGHLFSGNIHMITADGVLNCNLPFNEIINNEIVVNYSHNWDLISLAIQTGLFPCNNMDESTLYGFSVGGYMNTEIDEMEMGTGYWLRFEEAEDCTFTGEFINQTTITINDDWNLIGSISSPVNVNTILDESNLIIPGTVYGFDGGYFEAETIEPGYGYWLRSSGEGEITLSSSVFTSKSNSFQKLEHMNTLTLNNFSLYFGNEIEVENPLSYSLPPKPPVPATDIRFSGDTKLCSSDECLIEVMNDGSPLTFECELKDGESWEIVDESGNVFECEGVQVLDVGGDSKTLVLRKTTSPQTPTEFALFPAHPNPFNPVTTIRFSVSDVETLHATSLRIYDITGKLVETLVDGDLSPGNHSVKWNAQSQSSGVYFTMLKIENKQILSQKMVLLN